MSDSVSNLESAAASREKVIVRTSAIGILTNVLLAAFKAGVGLAANSIAVILDAVNNLSDALSSIVTIVGTKLAGMSPDRQHPLGHGRIEYLSAMIVAGFVLYAGIASAVESVKKIFRPETPEYSAVSLAIIAVAVVVKLLLGRYVKRKGDQVKSDSLAASGADALFDAILSASVLASALIFLASGISLEAYVGVVIATFIIKSGIGMMVETVNKILGARADQQTTDRIKQILNDDPQVHGAFDLILYNYGPNKDLASAHVELPDTMTVKEVDKLTRKLETAVFRETGVILAGLGVYACNTGTSDAAKIQEEVRSRVMAHPWAVQFHGFYIDLEAKEMRFDVVLSFDVRPRDALQVLHAEMKHAYPDYAIQIVPDVDVSV